LLLKDLLVVKEYILKTETFQNVQVIQTSGTSLPENSTVRWDQLDITFQQSSRSNAFIALSSQFEDQEILAFKENKACNKDADCTGTSICLNGFCNSVHWAPLKQATLNTFELGNNF